MRTSVLFWTLLLACLLSFSISCGGGGDDDDDSGGAPADDDVDDDVDDDDDVNDDVDDDVDDDDLDDDVDDDVNDDADDDVDDDTTEATELNGAFEKGPFITGSSISISAIDDNGNPTGDVFNTQTINYLGEFEVTLNYRGFISLSGTGIYYNEITGGLSDTSITLQAYHKILGGGVQEAYVNLVTHLTYKRVQTLIGQGMDIAPAIAQAEEELRLTSGIGVEGFDPGEDGIDMNILGGDTPANQYLFAVSAVLAQVAWTRANAKGVDSELQNLLNNLSNDLAPDGLFTQSVINEIHQAQINLNADIVMLDLTDYLTGLGSPMGVPDLHRVLDQDFDETVNAEDNCRYTYNPLQTDRDVDTVGDECDNCPDINNLSQSNGDTDDYGDACDCDDERGDIHPGAEEICDGVDNNCVDDIDEGGNALCDDAVFCNGQETCQGLSECQAGSYPCTPDDGLWCNGTESCDEESDSCPRINVPDCSDDGLWCNGDDFCNDTVNQCNHSGDPCDDGTFCNGEEYCDEVSNVCGTSPGNPCPDDGAYCNGNESCNESSDSCDHSGDPCEDPPLCDENFDFCTTWESGDEEVFVSEGNFQMGCEPEDTECDEDGREEPLHEVWLSAYYIDIYEVNNTSYAEFLTWHGNDCEGYDCVKADSPYLRLSESGGVWSADAGYEEHPLVDVTWYGAKAYCEAQGKRLPTEAEWEKAAKGAAEHYLWPWGDTWIANAANYGNSGDPFDNGMTSGTTPVGYYDGSDHGGVYQTTDGRSPYGAHDMAGNVLEWVSDWYGLDYYDEYLPYSWPADPQGPVSGTYRVYRGGGWNDYPQIMRASTRDWNAPTIWSDNLGFRCSRD